MNPVCTALVTHSESFLGPATGLAQPLSGRLSGSKDSATPRKLRRRSPVMNNRTVTQFLRFLNLREQGVHVREEHLRAERPE